MNMKKLCSLFVAASVLLLVGCGEKYYKFYNERTYQLNEDIVAIEVGDGIDVVVDSTLAKEELLVFSNKEDFSNFELKVENGKLSVSVKSVLIPKVYKVYVPAFNFEALKLSGGSDLEWDGCAVDKLAVEVSGGSDCEVAGHCNTLVVEASGGSDADLEDLLACDVTVEASGGSDVSVHATRTISVVASGGADVHIEGTPQITGWNVSGGADVYINK
jgi:hypothetical protein